MKQKMKLDHLKVESFITENTNEVKGGTLLPSFVCPIFISQAICPSAYDACPSAPSGCLIFDPNIPVFNPFDGFGFGG